MISATKFKVKRSIALVATHFRHTTSVCLLFAWKNYDFLFFTIFNNRSKFCSKWREIKFSCRTKLGTDVLHSETVQRRCIQAFKRRNIQRLFIAETYLQSCVHCKYRGEGERVVGSTTSSVSENRIQNVYEWAHVNI